MTYTEIQNEVIKKYRVNIDSNSRCWSRTHAHVRERRICKWNRANSVVSTFTLFHEIGHIETTKSGMRRMESELYATLWAFDRCREYGVKIPERLWKMYNSYILRERDRGIRRGGGNYPKFELPKDIIA